MRLATRFLFAGFLLGMGAWLASAADAGGAVKCRSGEFKPIRGFCSDEYLRFDILDEVGRAAAKLAREKYFPLVLDWSQGDRALNGLSVQIRHDETPLRSRKWRGEFLILIRDKRPALTAEFVRAESPLWVQVHRYLHEGHYSKIAAAFSRSTLRADDPAWAAEVLRLLPSVEEVAAVLRVERFVTDDQSCPAVRQRIQVAARLAPEPVIEAEESNTISVQTHPERYDVVLANYPRLFYTTDTEPERAFFKWAEETVEALGPCWKPSPDAGK